MDKYIVIAGNIGAGKSTLVEKLCDKMNWIPYFEPVSENPYLEDFYARMERWSFHSQIFFLADRMASHQHLHGQLNKDISSNVVQDRSIYEDGEIFARNLYRRGKMSERDFSTYMKLYSTSIALLPPPDLMVYLKASVPTLQERIARRNRDFEQTISSEYLNDLNSLYERWIESYILSPVLRIDGDRTDIIDNHGDLDKIVERIENALNFGQEKLF